MFTGINSLLVHQQREELAREIDSQRLAGTLWSGRRPDREHRWAFWLPREVEAPANMPPSRKIRLLRDAGSPTRT